MVTDSVYSQPFTDNFYIISDKDYVLTNKASSMLYRTNKIYEEVNDFRNKATQGKGENEINVKLDSKDFEQMKSVVKWKLARDQINQKKMHKGKMFSNEVWGTKYLQNVGKRSGLYKKNEVLDRIRRAPVHEKIENLNSFWEKRNAKDHFPSAFEVFENFSAKKGKKSPGKISIGVPSANENGCDEEKEIRICFGDTETINESKKKSQQIEPSEKNGSAGSPPKNYLFELEKHRVFFSDSVEVSANQEPPSKTEGALRPQRTAISSFYPKARMIGSHAKPKHIQRSSVGEFVEPKSARKASILGNAFKIKPAHSMSTRQSLYSSFGSSSGVAARKRSEGNLAFSSIGCSTQNFIGSTTTQENQPNGKGKEDLVIGNSFKLAQGCIELSEEIKALKKNVFEKMFFTKEEFEEKQKKENFLKKKLKQKRRGNLRFIQNILKKD